MFKVFGTMSLVCMLSAVSLAVDGKKSSHDFAYRYEADVLPEFAGLNFVLNDSKSIVDDTVSVANGVLTINTNTNSTVNDSIWLR